jgi:hypothetical protein
MAARPLIENCHFQPYFSDAERAPLALTEAVTRLSDRPTPSRTKSGKRPPGTMMSAAWQLRSWQLPRRMFSIGSTSPMRQVAGAEIPWD